VVPSEFVISSFKSIITSFGYGGELSSSTSFLIIELFDTKDLILYYKRVVVFRMHRLQHQKCSLAIFVARLIHLFSSQLEIRASSHITCETTFYNFDSLVCGP
jgi:hypothetical protein